MTTPFKSACWLGSAVDSNRNYLVDVDVQTVFLRQPDQILHAPPTAQSPSRWPCGWTGSTSTSYPSPDAPACAFKLPLGDAGPPEVGVVSEPDGAVAADVKLLRQGVSHVRHPVFATGLTKKPDGDWMIITLFRTETSPAPSTMRKPSVRPCGIDRGGSKVCERPGTGNLSQGGRGRAWKVNNPHRHHQGQTPATPSVYTCPAPACSIRPRQGCD